MFVIDLAKWWFIVAYGTLAFFCFGMSLYRAYRAKTLTKTLWVLFGWTVPLFLFADFICNTFCGSIILLEPPVWHFGANWRDSEVMLTARLSRWEKSDSWRGRVAKWLCHNLLDPLDPRGQHCYA
jgi:hypothetical protein